MSTTQPMLNSRLLLDTHHSGDTCICVCVCVVQIKVAKLLYSNVYVNCPTLPHHILVVQFLLDILPISPALSATRKKKEKKKSESGYKVESFRSHNIACNFHPLWKKAERKKDKEHLVDCEESSMRLET